MMLSSYRNNRAEVLFLLTRYPMERMTLRYITQTLDMKTHAVWNALNTLVRDGLVTKYTDGKYAQYRLSATQLEVRR